ncbi:MAG: BON domain-containing protein [Gemmatimonadaceae bacterium]
MTPLRYHDDESSTGTSVATTLLGAVAGFAVGMYVAQRMGGLTGLTARLRGQPADDGVAPAFEFSGDEYDEIEEDASAGADAVDTADDDVDDDLDDDLDEDDDPDDGVPQIEERVLEAFNHDPILAERAIDIGGIGGGVIELAGWVQSDEEAEHAITIARGVPDVDTVVNRLMIEDEEDQLDDNVRRVQQGDPALTESHWEGQQVGMGKRRQGTSGEPDRHADPKPALENRWLSESEAVRNAAEEIDTVAAERRKTRNRNAKPADEEARS